ncbi:lantibiotic dehydratase [Nocardiopsis quinghaiensis]|uniref:lantibiotic dehydratase n=1 Tax=Nocardiopsis quinghaiensis TaxID=464995 RepID=UPI00123A1697|nr:lantibiotic dehydratase [Nocardiopsis quinghaiensis]
MTSSRTDHILYSQASTPLIRATTCPPDLAFPDAPDLTGDAEEVAEQGTRWLAHVWRNELFRDAVETASPVLAEQVGRTLTGQRLEARRVRRLVHSLGAYLLRWKGRATPFGLFAGIAEVRVGTRTRVDWTTDHLVATHPDADWLGDVIDRLEQHPALMDLVTVVANNTTAVRGDRLVIPGLTSGERPSELAPLEVSIRHTRPVRTAMVESREPLPFGDLVKVLTADHPQASAEQIRSLLADLVAQGFLLTGLRAPMNEPDALGHLCAQLERISADRLPEVGRLVTELRQVHQDLPRGRGAAETIRPLVGRMRAISATTRQPLAVDTVLGADITLPEEVLKEAEAAVSTMVRLTPYPYGYPRWKDFHSRFRERYGPGAVVSVTAVLADTGLGLPADYLGSPHTSTRPAPTDRDQVLLALAQEAALTGRTEVALTDQLIDQIRVGDPADVVPPPRVEMAFQLHAPSPQAMDRGDFRLMVTSAPRPGSSMAGRAAGLLPAPARDHIADSYTAHPAPVVTAQLSFPPRRRRTENVVRTPRLLPTTIPLAEHHRPGEDVIGLSDLAVTADARQLHLVQLSTGRRVEPRVPHALEAAALTPPLARFLTEVPTGRCAVYQAFDWGAAACLPFLPRLRHGRTILTAARWKLSASDLPTTAAPPSRWEDALEDWRARLHAPASVIMCNADLRLPLNLDRALDRALLRTRLDRSGSVKLREAPAPRALGWMGRAHEVLVAFHRPTPAPTRTPLPSTTVTTRTDAGQLPGCSSLVRAQIHGHPARQDEILLHHLPRLVDGWDGLRLWWFTRHRDTAHPDRDQHLDLYLRLRSAQDYGRAITRVGEWVADLRSHGLASHLQLATYHPQTGRYGHQDAMDAAEQVFAADSAAALAQTELATAAGTPGEAITAAGLTDLSTSYVTSPHTAAEWLTTNLPRHHLGLDRGVRDQALRLAVLDGESEALNALPGGPNVLQAWGHRRVALEAYRARLSSQRDPDPVLRSLLHLHHVRALGVDPDRERITHHLARATALRHLALTKGARR